MRNEIINKLLQLSEQEHNRHPEWRKGQSIINCTYIYCEHLTKDFMHTKVDCFYKDSLINDFLKLLEEKIKTSEPFVGIFWFYNGFVIFPHAVQLTNGLHYGNTITGTKDHADYWDELAGHLSCSPDENPFLHQEPANKNGLWAALKVRFPLTALPLSFRGNHA